MRANEWDRIICAIEESAAAGAAAHLLLDPAAAAWERRLGVGDDARKALFGDRKTWFRSVLLSYISELRKKAREERAAETAYAEPDEWMAKTHPENAGPPLALLRRAAESVFEPKPKILPGDSLTPRERIERHIRFEKADRVAVAPQLGFHTARAGGITVREFMTDGRAAAAAARRTWDIYGGFDMIPFYFPAGYLFPLPPDPHSRFYSRWVLPIGDELPKMDERPLLDSYDALTRDGLSAMVRTEGGKLIGGMLSAGPRWARYFAEIAVSFPQQKHFHPYAGGVVNHPADLLSMWFGFERFMTDCATDPARVREACERLGPGLVELGALSARASGINQLLYGVSRISASWISRKMFDSLFAGTFLEQVRRIHGDGIGIVYHLDNDYTPALDFFLELPKHSGFMHFDQTDLVKAKKVLHGHLCLMGNLHPGLLAAGSPAQVAAECERLICEVGAGGGFILASACEVPIDTPIENLKALKDTVNRKGWY